MYEELPRIRNSRVKDLIVAVAGTSPNKKLNVHETACTNNRTSEAAADMADRVAVDMEAQAHMDDEKKRVSGYPSTLLREMHGGHSLYPPYVPRLGTEAEDSV